MSSSKRPNPRTVETVYRTYRLDDSTRIAMKEQRQQEGKTVAAFLKSAIYEQLPSIINELVEVGIPLSLSKEAQPSRLPMTDGLINLLKQGAQKTGVPSTRLLIACINRATNK